MWFSEITKHFTVSLAFRLQFGIRVKRNSFDALKKQIIL